MHSERAIALVQPWRTPSLLALGIAATGSPLLLTTLATGAADAALVGLSLLFGAATFQGLRIRRWLDRLPLEIAPLGGAGTVNGVRVYRFRFRLGRGRPLKDLVVRVSFQPDRGGAPVELPVGAPQGLLTGPVTVVASDPTWATATPGRFLLSGSCEGGGERWEARAEIHSSAIREGSFGGIDVRNGRVEFTSDWTAVTARERTLTPPKR